MKLSDVLEYGLVLHHPKSDLLVDSPLLNWIAVFTLAFVISAVIKIALVREN